MDPNQQEKGRLDERLALANRLFREYHASCFWHSPRDLVITEELIPFVVKGLRRYGGHQGFFAAAPLRDRAKVSRGGDQLQLDWATDSAFRFFPAQPDPDFGYCLHPADLATNKVLALAGRTEIRDFIDILFIYKNYLSLGAVIWAACGKDQGFTPSLLLDQANCHSRFQENDLRSEQLSQPVDLKDLKRQWIAARTEAEKLFERLPETELGCLYLRDSDRPVSPIPESVEFPTLQRHFGSIQGAAPKFA